MIANGAQKRQTGPALAVVVALAALAPLGFAVPTLALAVTAALVVVALATWDSATYLGRTRWRETGP